MYKTKNKTGKVQVRYRRHKQDTNETQKRQVNGRALLIKTRSEIKKNSLKKKNGNGTATDNAADE